MVVIGDDGALDVLAENLDVLQMRGDDEFLLVDTPFHEYHFMIVHEGTAHLNGFANGTELPCAIACYNDGVRVVESPPFVPREGHIGQTG